ncbi:Fungal Zn binuclear cluster domain containing protein [Neofusicoccum parvum]|nr:Fungal Zn binuclear cluster domain containing protein [Neofusicoccum parvum]
MTDPQAPDSAGAAAALPRRNYQACLECKRHKVKCNMGSSESPQPPCIRCRRAQLQCVFGPVRRLRSRVRRKNGAGVPPTAAAAPIAPPVDAREDDFRAESRSPPHAEAQAHSETHHDVREGSPDAAEATVPSTDDARAAAPGYNLSSWNHFNLCRDGYLTPAEADHLVDHFFRWMHPIFPLVDQQYSSRLIEGIVLLVEWHTRSLDLVSPPMDISGPYALGSYSFNPCPSSTLPDVSNFESEVLNASETIKSLLTATWRLLGIAITLSDEIGLHQVITKAGERQMQDGTDGPRRARVRDFLVTLVWEHSFRLGRKCVLVLPPTPPEPAQREPASQLSAFLDSRTELYRLLQLVESTVYSTPRHTADIITSGRYVSIISDFSGYLAAWRSRFEHLKGPGPLRKHLEIIWHSARTFLNCVAVQAFAIRCATAGRRPSSRGAGAGAGAASNTQSFTQSAQHYQDLSLAEDVTKDAEQVLEIALALHREGYLRHAPMNLMYHIMAASMLLLKLQLLPVRISGKRGAGDPMAPLKQIAKALEEAGIDDVHVCCRFASCFKRLMRKIEADRGQPRPTVEASDPGHQGLESVSGILWPSGDPDAAADATGAGLPFGTSLCEGLFSLEQDGEWPRWLAF